MRLASPRRVAIFTAAVAALLSSECGPGAKPYGGAAGPHFDGRRFHNETDVEAPSLGDFLTWRGNREVGHWERWSEAPPGPPPPERVGPGEMRVTFVNHATLLLQMDSVNILTDPIWSERTSPVKWAGPRRRRPPGIRFEELPPIDAVMVSHNHYDHMDLATLRRLAEKHHPRILVGLGNRAYLEERAVPGAEDVDWWRGVPLSDEVRVVPVPAQHFSARGASDRDHTLWCGFVVQGPSGAAYFAGDTGFGPHFREIRATFGPLRLAMLPIGSYLPRWFMSPVHMSPFESVLAHRELEAGTSVGMHYGTFKLGDDGQYQGLADLAVALDLSLPPKPRFWTLDFGEGRDVPPVE